MDRLQALAQSNPLLVAGFVGVTVAIVVTEIRSLFRGYNAVSPAQLTALINHENALVVDIRGLSEFEKGHIIGARHLLPSEVQPEHRLLAKSKEAPVVLVCAAGMSASAVAAKLVKGGFKRVSVLDGGIGGWQSAGLPLARGKA